MGCCSLRVYQAQAEASLVPPLCPKLPAHLHPAHLHPAHLQPTGPFRAGTLSQALRPRSALVPRPQLLLSAWSCCKAAAWHIGQGSRISFGDAFDMASKQGTENPRGGGRGLNFCPLLGAMGRLAQRQQRSHKEGECSNCCF